MAFAVNLFAVWLSAVPSDSPVHVTVDWSAVSDRTVQRCGLSGLQAMLLQTLLEGGFAVLENSASAEMTLILEERPRRLVVMASGRGVTREEVVKMLGRCDATIQFPLQRAALSVLRQVQEAWPPPESVTTDALPPDTAANLASQPGWSLSASLRAGTAIHNATHPFGTVGGGITIDWQRTLSLHVAGEVAVCLVRALTLIEPALVVSLSKRLWHTGPLSWHAGMAIAVLGHLFSVDGTVSGHADVQARAPLTVIWDGIGLFLQLTPSIRGRPVVHRLNGSEVFAADRFGGAASLGFMFGPHAKRSRETPNPPRASND